MALIGVPGRVIREHPKVRVVLIFIDVLGDLLTFGERTVALFQQLIEPDV